LLAFGAWAIAVRAPRPATPARGIPAADPARTGNAYLAFLRPLRHRSSRALLAVFALNAIAPAITATVFQFFVADRLALPAAVPGFLALYFIAGAASMPGWVRLAQRASLHVVWLAGMVAAVLAFVWAWQLQPGQAGAFAVICVLSGLAFGADLAVPPALLARVIDANGDGGRREGVYFGLWNFVNKLCLALAGGIALPLLQVLGYAQGAADPGALDALATVYAVVPCGLKLMAAALLAVAWRRAWF
jgi:Na+/melibiose symporter-like transporter